MKFRDIIDKLITSGTNEEDLCWQEFMVRVKIYYGCDFYYGTNVELSQEDKDKIENFLNEIIEKYKDAPKNAKDVVIKTHD